MFFLEIFLLIEDLGIILYIITTNIIKVYILGYILGDLNLHFIIIIITIIIIIIIIVKLYIKLIL